LQDKNQYVSEAVKNYEKPNVGSIFTRTLRGSTRFCPFFYVKFIMALALLNSLFFKLFWMTIDYFQTLGLKAQKFIVAFKGSQIAEKQTKDYDTALFQVDGFYVEFYYEPGTDTIVWVNSFDDLEDLDFYLEDIDVSALSLQN
jgi:hypothetical protein